MPLDELKGEMTRPWPFLIQASFHSTVNLTVSGCHANGSWHLSHKMVEGQAALRAPSTSMPVLGRKCRVAHIGTGAQKASVNYPGQFISLAPGIVAIVPPSDDGQELDK